MTREEAIQWLKVINTKKFGWDEFALQESQREIRERCEQGVREALRMAIEALSADVVMREVYDKRTQTDEEIIDSYREKLANCHKEILRLLDFDDAIERQNDVIEVVRCKDCRYSRFYQTDSKGTMQTNCVAFVMSRTVTDDDFCSWGERREK